MLQRRQGTLQLRQDILQRRRVMLHAAGVVFKGREAAEKAAESGGDKPDDGRRKSHANCAMSITYEEWHKNQKKVYNYC